MADLMVGCRYRQRVIQIDTMPCSAVSGYRVASHSIRTRYLLLVLASHVLRLRIEMEA